MVCLILAILARVVFLPIDHIFLNVNIPKDRR